MDKPARSPLLLPRAAHACREPLRRKDEAPWHSPPADRHLRGGLSPAGSPPLWIVGRRRRPARPVAAALAPWLPQARLSRPGCRLDDRLPHQGVGRPRLEVGDEPGGGLAGDLLQRAGLLEQVAGASPDPRAGRPAAGAGGGAGGGRGARAPPPPPPRPPPNAPPPPATTSSRWGAASL